ncbi:hypothetical protein I79_008445 [Cricetulus griseus]|uniref:Uncharacterized protein n=1 Tax=Cricetulus griseus TaxID=10029 RepID=G3HD69_CRIGR|nr:hypothetical protein I79_008445 [Cricetulus griseus]
MKPLSVCVHMCSKCMKYNNFITRGTLYLASGINTLHSWTKSFMVIGSHSTVTLCCEAQFVQTRDHLTFLLLK